MAFISLHDNVDLSTPSRRLMLQIIGAMAEFERALIKRKSGAIEPGTTSGEREIAPLFSASNYPST